MGLAKGCVVGNIPKKTIVVVHCVKVLHNVLELVCQYFVFLSPEAIIFYKTMYFAADKDSVEY